MENITDKILKFLRLDTLISNLSGYVEARVELVKIEIREEVASVLSRGILMMAFMLIGFMCLLFLTLGLAQYLNAVLESEFAGYFAIGIFFGLVLTILLLARKSFSKSLENKFKEVIKHRHH